MLWKPKQVLPLRCGASGGGSSVTHWYVLRVLYGATNACIVLHTQCGPAFLANDVQYYLSVHGITMCWRPFAVGWRPAHQGGGPWACAMLAIRLSMCSCEVFT